MTRARLTPRSPSRVGSRRRRASAGPAPTARPGRRARLRRFGQSVAALLALLFGSAAGAQDAGVVAPNHPIIESHHQLVKSLEKGLLSLNDVRRRGLSVFSTPFNKADGFGDGPFDPAATDATSPGNRPTLQGGGMALRVNGLDAQSCNECHTIVSNRTRPPTLGIAGVGGLVQNAMIMPTMIDVSDSSDERVVFQPSHDPMLAMLPDGVADFNGRFANPPFLFGGGGVELLAKEMTADLQALLAVARTSPAGTVVPLESHGVTFGSLTSLAGGQVDLSGVEGVGPADRAGRNPEDVLVVRPFGRKGEAFSMRDFDRNALQFHFGVQPVEVVGEGVDGDGDGVVDEATVGELTALHIFDVTNPPPRAEPMDHDGARGMSSFVQIGCAGCHRPFLRTRTARLPLAYPEVATDPSANVYIRVNLAEVGFAQVLRELPGGGGVVVPLFSDLKRHAMGERLAESYEARVSEVARDEFITARLWGIADTAPYLHDGRAATLYEAIEMHGGEAQLARDAFLALSRRAQGQVLGFLGTLRAPRAPNEELVQGR